MGVKYPVYTPSSELRYITGLRMVTGMKNETNTINGTSNDAGTWVVGGPNGYNAAHITGPGGEIIAQVYGIPTSWSLRDCAHAIFAGTAGREVAHALAAAHLIAAAPELLAACKAALKFLDRPRNSVDESELCGQLRAAVEKTAINRPGV